MTLGRPKLREESVVLSELSDPERRLLRRVLEIELGRVGQPEADTTEEILQEVRAIYP